MGLDPRPGMDGASHRHGLVCGAGTFHPGVRIRPHAFPWTKPDIKGHAIGNVERTWEARKAFSVKTCFLAFFCPTRPSPPAPVQDCGEAAGTYRLLEMGCAYIQHTYSLSKWARGAAGFLSSPMGCSDLRQVNSHCHPGVFLIIFLGLCRFNSSSATLLYKPGVNPTSNFKLSPCNQYFTCFAATPLANF